MSYNLLSSVPEVVNYLEQAAGFYYLQNPTSWQQCFENLSSVPKLTEFVGGAAQAEITNIKYAYESVGKDIYATAQSGLKNAPVIEGIFTQADQEVANVGEAALGTYVAGVSVAVPMSVAIVGIIGGLGIGILGYETAPEGWVDISNAIFGTNIAYEEVQPLIKTYISGLMSKDSNDNVYIYMNADYIENAYNYFAQHISGGIDYAWLDNTVWEPSTSGGTVPNKCTSATQQYLQHVSMPVSDDELTARFIKNVFDTWVKGNEKVGIEDMPEITVGFNDIINNLYSLYPNYHNANMFRVTFRFMKVYSTVNTFQVVIDGFRVADDVFDDISFSEYRELIYTIPSTVTSFTNDMFSYSSSLGYTLQCLFSYKYDFDTNTGIVKDDGSSYEAYGTSTLRIGIWGSSNNDQGVEQNICMLWSVGAEGSVFPGLDDELTEKGFIIDPKLNEDVDPEEAQQKKPDRKTNFQDQYAYWYGGKKRVAQPDKNGEPDYTTYIPTPVPAHIPDAAQQTVKHGSGVQDDPDSLPVEVPEAMPDAMPNPMPEDAPATELEDAQEKAIDKYNKSRTTPDTAPDPRPDYEPNPQYPDNPPNDPNGDSGDTPTPSTMSGVTASGLCSVYNPTKAQLVSFSGWLWSSNFIDNFVKIFQNPMDAIIGLHILYATPTTGSSANIVCGYLDSGVSSKVVTQQFSTINCGTVTVPEYYGNALDYEPYTQVHCYLPFIGIVALKPNDVLGKQLNIQYGVDALTGTCLATLTSKQGNSDIACYTFAGNCATQIPISGGSYAQMITGLAGVAVSAIAGAATGNPIALLGAGASILNTHLDVQHSGSIGSNAGAMGIRKPYLIITRKSAYDAAGYGAFYGYPANKTVTLGNCKGYTRVKSVHVEIARATANEKREIDTLLREGVIIN